MIQGFYSAASGMTAQQINLDSIANNISNINTVGYKSARTDFKDALYSQIPNPADLSPIERGSGTIVASNYRHFVNGVPFATESPLDLALQSDGFFSLLTPQGETVYTRDGNFTISPESDGNYLVNSSGYYVLDSNYQKITVPDPSNFTVSSNGAIDGTDQRIGLFSFTSNEGLEAVGGNNFKETAASGHARDAESPDLWQGYLEGSNVDLAGEMVRLVKAQRAYQLSARAVTLIDQMEAGANNLRS